MKEVLLLLVMFWNVENFFDPFKDPVAADEEFTPGGARFWTWRKFEKKRDDIAKVILLVKQRYGVFPAVIGLCEVENRFVLHHLLERTPLAKAGYRIIHKDSPDKRGIDVAMLYDPQHFKLVQVRFFPLLEEEGGGVSVLASRFILYAKGVVGGLDTLHCFVNHWPSRLGGEARSSPRRMLASRTLKVRTDSILRCNGRANIILMGDFNDTPGSRPVTNLSGFVNMAHGVKGAGTYKYKGKWEVLDQFLVSESLAPAPGVHGESGYFPAGQAEQGCMEAVRWIYCKPGSMEIFRNRYLLEKDDVYMGEKLRRTLSGPRYLGGVSDHLPVLLRLFGIVF